MWNVLPEHALRIRVMDLRRAFFKHRIVLKRG